VRSSNSFSCNTLAAGKTSPFTRAIGASIRNGTSIYYGNCSCFILEAIPPKMSDRPSSATNDTGGIVGIFGWGRWESNGRPYTTRTCTTTTETGDAKHERAKTSQGETENALSAVPAVEKKVAGDRHFHG
jgi:hypothetical protein